MSNKERIENIVKDMDKATGYMVVAAFPNSIEVVMDGDLAVQSLLLSICEETFMVKMRERMRPNKEGTDVKKG